MKYPVEDLGPQAFWDGWMGFRFGRNPKRGAEVAIGALSLGGFMVIDPIAQKGIQATPEKRIPNGGLWAVGQAPDGTIYQTGVFATKKSVPLFCWNWEGDTSKIVAEIPGQ